MNRLRFADKMAQVAGGSVACDDFIPLKKQSSCEPPKSKRAKLISEPAKSESRYGDMFLSVRAKNKLESTLRKFNGCCIFLITFFIELEGKRYFDYL